MRWVGVLEGWGVEDCDGGGGGGVEVWWCGEGVTGPCGSGGGGGGGRGGE